MFGFKHAVKVFSVKFSLPMDLRKFSPSKVYCYTVYNGCPRGCSGLLSVWRDSCVRQLALFETIYVCLVELSFCHCCLSSVLFMCLTYPSGSSAMTTFEPLTLYHLRFYALQLLGIWSRLHYDDDQIFWSSVLVSMLFSMWSSTFNVWFIYT